MRVVKLNLCFASQLFSLFFLQEKFDALNREHVTRVQDLETQVKQLQTKAEESAKRIRELEQTNDDLERANRYVFKKAYHRDLFMIALTSFPIQSSDGTWRPR